MDQRGDWDSQADTFDEEADHGLRDPRVHLAWRNLLAPLLPSPPARVADLGCGTGTLSLLLSEAGLDVTGVDFAPRMVATARRKLSAAGVRPDLVVGDAMSPPLLPGAFDLVLVRHLLWAMPDQRSAIEGWGNLLRPRGRLVLIEGFWATGSGIHMENAVALVKHIGLEVAAVPLDNEALWGKPIGDERYLLIAQAG